MNISTGVFERTGSHDITESSFYGLISFFVLLGLGVTARAAPITPPHRFQPPSGRMLLLGLALPILGIVIATRTENPSVAFLGYLLITGSFGFMLGPIGNQYSPHVLRDVAGMTAGITLLMRNGRSRLPPDFLPTGRRPLRRPHRPAGAAPRGAVRPQLQFQLDRLPRRRHLLPLHRLRHVARQRGLALEPLAIQIAVSLYLDVLNLFLTLLNAHSRD